MIRYPARRRTKRGQRGVVAIQVGIFLVVLLGVAALTIDVARWVIVRNELQNAADAAALAGARQLPGSLVATANSTTWNTAITNATTTANTYASKNYANGKTIVTPQTVMVGYWDVNAANQGTSLPPSLPTTIGSPTDKPAVMVTVSLDPANGTGLPLLLAPILSLASSHSTVPTSLYASATAVAIISAPGTAQPGSLFPMVVSNCLYSSPIYWNNGNPNPTTGEFSIGVGAVGLQGCNSGGQWTSFNLGSPSATAAQGLITTGNTSSLTMGQNTFIQPGTKSSIYNNFPVTPPMLVTVPVVSDSSLTSTSGINTPVLGFAGFMIDYVVGDNGKPTPSCTGTCTLPINCKDCIIGHLAKGIAGGTSAGGTTSTYFGTVTPPILANLPSSEWY